MSRQTPVMERVFRAITHINIGASLGMVAWMMWSGTQIVTGQWEIPHPPALSTPQPASPSKGAPCPVHGSLSVDIGLQEAVA